MCGKVLNIIIVVMHIRSYGFYASLNAQFSLAIVIAFIVWIIQ